MLCTCVRKSTAEFEARLEELRTQVRTLELQYDYSRREVANSRAVNMELKCERDKAVSDYQQYKHDTDFELEMLKSVLKQLTININLRGK